RHLLSDKAFPWLFGQSDQEKSECLQGFQACKRSFFMLKHPKKVKIAILFNLFSSVFPLFSCRWLNDIGG
ncbi:MAG: hypothetical protein Q4G00_15710, partial [Clostridia bacterium]|nr:hypothetical protein [Clostridia bacterium]